MCRKKQFYIDGLKNAGSVFIGNFSPETLGDYASGTNHTANKWIPQDNIAE